MICQTNRWNNVSLRLEKLQYIYIENESNI